MVEPAFCWHNSLTAQAMNASGVAMKVDVRTNHFYSSHHQPRSSARGEDIPSFAAALESTAVDRRPTNADFHPDFTDMSRAEMRGWINDRIQAGTMTVDESTPLMLMTMKIPVGGEDEMPPSDDNERIDFK